MRNNLRQFNALALAVMIITMVVALAFVSIAYVEQEQAVSKQYDNKMHENFCILATDRGASDEYLLSNDC